jgi:hypothetical protein
MEIIATMFWTIAKNSAAYATEKKVAEMEICEDTVIDAVDQEMIQLYNHNIQAGDINSAQAWGLLCCVRYNQGEVYGNICNSLRQRPQCTLHKFCQ